MRRASLDADERGRGRERRRLTEGVAQLARARRIRQDAQ
jgi:hypothetical protein